MLNNIINNDKQVIEKYPSTIARLLLLLTKVLSPLLKTSMLNNGLHSHKKTHYKINS